MITEIINYFEVQHKVQFSTINLDNVKNDTTISFLELFNHIHSYNKTLPHDIIKNMCYLAIPYLLIDNFNQHITCNNIKLNQFMSKNQNLNPINEDSYLDNSTVVKCEKIPTEVTKTTDFITANEMTTNYVLTQDILSKSEKITNSEQIIICNYQPIKESISAQRFINSSTHISQYYNLQISDILTVNNESIGKVGTLISDDKNMLYNLKFGYPILDENNKPLNPRQRFKFADLFLTSKNYDILTFIDSNKGTITFSYYKYNKNNKHILDDNKIISNIFIVYHNFLFHLEKAINYQLYILIKFTNKRHVNAHDESDNYDKSDKQYQLPPNNRKKRKFCD